MEASVLIGGVLMAEAIDEKANYWPCACVKRNRDGLMTHIKLLPPTERKCRVCGAIRPPNLMLGSVETE